MSQKISVIIPSYNHEKYISMAVNSVLAQSYENWELIIIDDGSKDNSWEYLTSLQDPRINVSRHENKGAHATINEGLNKATGDFLTILNSDDMYASNRFEIFLNYLNNNPEISLVCSYIQIIDDKGKKLGIKEGWHNCEPWLVDHPELSYKTLNDFTANLIMSNFVSTTSNIFMRKNVYDTIGGMKNFRFVHDWDFLLRVAASFECAILDQPLMNYRIHGSNTISSNQKWLLFENCLVIASNIDQFLDTTIFPSSDPTIIQQNYSRFYQSMNLQSNDKIYWTIKSYIDAFRKRGVLNPEELFLDDIKLRESIVDLITIPSENPIPLDNLEGEHIGFKEKLRRIRHILRTK